MLKAIFAVLFFKLKYALQPKVSDTRPTGVIRAGNEDAMSIVAGIIIKKALFTGLQIYSCPAKGRQALLMKKRIAAGWCKALLRNGCNKQAAGKNTDVVCIAVVDRNREGVGASSAGY